MSSSNGGFVSLFDGETLTGWHAVPRLHPLVPHDPRAETTSGRWEVSDGVIVGGQEVPGYGGYLVSDEKFGDFELLVDANPDWPADTGILVRATDLGSQGFQILVDHRKSGSIGGFFDNSTSGFHALTHTLDVRLDDAGRPVGLVEEDPTTTFEPITQHKRDLLSYGASAAQFLAAWNWNDWNTFRIRCEGRYPVLTVWINGVLMTEIDTAAVRHDGYDRDVTADLLGRAGRISFEVHDNDQLLGDARWGRGAVCRWRDIRVRPL